jgi:hypothetical protein
MALFQKKTPEPEPPRVTGFDVLRQALKNRNARVNGVSGLKDELKVPFAAIADFINGTDGALTGPQLDQAAKFLWGGAVEFDSESRMLRSANRAPAKSVGVAPEPWRGGSNVPVLEGRTLGQIYNAPLRPRPPGADDKPAAPSRPGWV